jgi:succinate dehydrogenase/fumarate reductase flavoprotein subunit
MGSRGDIIVVGAGLAGMVAAYTAHKAGASVMLVDRGSLGIGTNSALSNGIFAGPGASYSAGKYAEDTMEIGRFINHKPLVEFVAREAPEAFRFLASLGLPVVRSGLLYAVPASRPGIIPGVTLVKGLIEAIAGCDGIRAVTGFYVTRILHDDRGVQGVRGFDSSGSEMDFLASAVILAGGGAGAVYLRNDNQKQTMGQGYLLAAMAGVDLWDMEFVQFYPLVITGTHLPAMLLYPPHPREARLTNSKGEDLMDKYGLKDINDALVTKRDEFSALLFRETLTGPVYMDLHSVPAGLWEDHPLALLARLRFNVKEKPIPVSPGAHFFMGGVRTDEKGQTSIPGLFACGEMEWGLHGANRRGGNALTECIVSGKRAGIGSLDISPSRGTTTAPPDRPATANFASSGRRSGRFREVRQRIREIAWDYAGVIRSEAGMLEGLARTEEIDRGLRAIVPHGPGEMAVKQDLTSGALMLRAVLFSGLGRLESRGSFIRSDFPSEEDTRWRKNSRLSYDPVKEAFSLTYHEVPAGQ